MRCSILTTKSGFMSCSLAVMALKCEQPWSGKDPFGKHVRHVHFSSSSAHGLVKLQPSKAVASCATKRVQEVHITLLSTFERYRHVHLDKAFISSQLVAMRVRTIEIAAACLLVLSLLGCYVTSLVPEADPTQMSR